jgi:hypothetical protein
MIAIFGCIFLCVLSTFTFAKIFYKSCGTETTKESKYVPRIMDTNQYRSLGQTYLTFPEWYVVYNADEYAKFIKTNPSSEYPYFESIKQYWSSYCVVYKYASASQKFNKDYNLMLMVVGFSHSFESGVRGIYEKTFGKLTEVIYGNVPTEEDLYAQKVNEEFANFIHTIPWYKFDYYGALKKLWAEVPIAGVHSVRKVERRIVLSTEFITKAIYAKLIGFAVSNSTGSDENSIQALVTYPQSIEGSLPKEVKVVKKSADGLVLVEMPRYQAFTNLVPGLVESGVRFEDIAGNNEIFITFIASKNWQMPTALKDKLVLRMEHIPEEDLERLGITVEVKDLAQYLNILKAPGAALEHIYDY